jgi:hypothetical protein
MKATGKAPESLADVPAYAEALAKRDKLQAELRELEERERELQGDIRTRASSPSNGIDAEAAELLANGDSAQSAASAREELSDVRHRAQVLRRAIELHNKALEQARSEASKAIAAAKLPEYKAIVGRMSKALSALREVIVEELKFRDALTAAGVSFSGVIRPMGCSMSEEAIDAWHAEGRQYGLI